MGESGALETVLRQLFTYNTLQLPAQREQEHSVNEFLIVYQHHGLLIDVQINSEM